jgi:hypothetical protein
MVVLLWYIKKEVCGKVPHTVIRQREPFGSVPDSELLFCGVVLSVESGVVGVVP